MPHDDIEISDDAHWNDNEELEIRGTIGGRSVTFVFPYNRFLEGMLVIDALPDDENYKFLAECVTSCLAQKDKLIPAIRSAIEKTNDSSATHIRIESWTS